MRIFVLALRNLTRNKRRTLITALAIVFGAAAIVWLQGFVNGYLHSLIQNTVQSKVGALQVFRKGYIGSEDPLKMSLREDPSLVANLQALPGVAAVSPRLDFDGMISNGAESTTFLATAIDPATEYKVCPKRLSNVADGSQALSDVPGHRNDAVLNRTLAESLGAKQGSTLTMQSAGPHASTNALDIVVTGFTSTLHFTESKRTTTVSLGFAQRLLRMKGLITEYVIGVNELDELDAVHGRVKMLLGEGYEVTTWRDMDPRVRDGTAYISYLLAFVAGVLFVLVATGIVNTMLMSVYERVREIGTMLALGVRRWQVMTLFLLEAATLGLGGSAGGVALGYAIVAGLARRGIGVPSPGGDRTTIYPYVGWHFLASVIGFALVGTILAALYPAWKAAHLRPVDALRAI